MFPVWVTAKTNINGGKPMYLLIVTGVGVVTVGCVLYEQYLIENEKHEEAIRFSKDYTSIIKTIAVGGAIYIVAKAIKEFLLF